MIRALSCENQHIFRRLVENKPCIAPVMEANSEVFAGHPALMRFYLCDESGALLLRGGGGLLCGEADDEELSGMLGFGGIDSLKTDGMVPFGWHAEETLRIMVLREIPAARALPGGAAFCEEPSMRQVMDLLQHEGLLGTAADNFYSEACTKRSRGLARVWTVNIGGMPAATAGAYAVTPREAYLSAVLTLPEHREQGLASALVAHAAAELAQSGRRVSLLCREALVPFYARIGFETVGELLQTRP